MRRVSQWKERLSDRRASKLSISFKSDTQPPSIDPDSSLPIAYPQAAISGSNTICDRCRFLGIENSSPRQYSLPCGMFATITKSSLTAQCSLCQQFRAVFDIANDPDMSSTTHSEFILSRSILQCPVQRYNAYDFYCLGIHWKHTLEEIRLIPTHLPPRDSYDETQLLGRSLIASIPDFSIIRGLLDKCQEEHESTCWPSSPMTSMLRLIDCRTRQILPATANQSYICLSYVWGQGTADGATTGSMLPDVVPKTVEDAMYVAINLGIPFLWVDRYCIDQQNSHDKHNIIQNMDRIYQGADLTIIATVGDDPHHGLPGIRDTPRSRQTMLKVKDCTYVAAESVTKEITQSKWGSRGWTYQEMLLSRRRLIFTGTQMYFQCFMEHHIESLTPGLTAGPFKDVYRVFPHGGLGHHASEFNNRLCEYYKRELSFNADIIDAFLGILNAFNAFKDLDFLRNPVTQFYGVPLCYFHPSETLLPTASFLDGLLWEVETPEGTPWKAPETFPSWSWASFKAAQPSEAPGDLRLRTNLLLDSFEMYEKVKVKIKHRSNGPTNIADFPYLESDYKQFEPWIEVTTWARSCAVRKHRKNHHGKVSLYSEDIKIYDPLAVQKGKVKAVCFRAEGLDVKEKKVSVAGLLVVETEPGLYRRVATFSCEIFPILEDLSHRARKELEQIFDPARPGNDKSKERQLREDGWTGPQVLGKLPKEKWQRRTLRLI